MRRTRCPSFLISFCTLLAAPGPGRLRSNGRPGFEHFVYFKWSNLVVWTSPPAWSLQKYTSLPRSDALNVTANSPAGFSP